ncbi:MAG: DUF3795 domain-containing protein [Bacteroidales bacterium]|nr:DUF3795 domain-containing protein [Bacteroidales bacterium]
MNNSDLIAPCGMNCAICLGYLREKNPCSGCRDTEGYKPNQCNNCIIINCDKLKETVSGFCYECADFPCKRLKQLDKRYSTKYNMSMLENLEYIKKNGLENFVKNEAERWKCDQCGGVICVHRGICLKCNKN